MQIQVWFNFSEFILISRGEHPILLSLLIKHFSLSLLILFSYFICLKLVCHIAFICSHLNLGICKSCLTFLSENFLWLKCIISIWRSATFLTACFNVFFYCSHSLHSKTWRGISICIVFLSWFLSPNTIVIFIISIFTNWWCCWSVVTSPFEIITAVVILINIVVWSIWSWSWSWLIICSSKCTKTWRPLSWHWWFIVLLIPLISSLHIDHWCPECVHLMRFEVKILRSTS